MDLYRTMFKGQYETDFSSIKPGQSFPSNEIRSRNAVYRYCGRLYSGEYAKNKKLIARVNSQETEIPYQVLSLNYFKLLINKLDSLIFGNDITVKTGDAKRDERIAKLVANTNWSNSIRQAVKQCGIYGDYCLKTYRNGVSAFSPLYAYKVIDKHNKENVIAYVLYECLAGKEDVNNIEYIRFEVHTKGKIYERVFQYNGNNVNGTIGQPVGYTYQNRVIDAKGNEYDTGIRDCECIQWLSYNIEADGVYGQSNFIDIKDVVFAIEHRLSSEMWVIDNHEKPFLIVGMNNIMTNEETGAYELKQINGKYLIKTDDGPNGQYLTWDGKLDNSKGFRDDLISYFYELSEMGRTFLSGEYSGNVSEETLNNMIKSAIDRANRHVNEVWNDVRDSLYCLCRLNGIGVNKEDININFNIGRTDDDKQVAEIAKILTDTGLLSKETLLERYFGYTKEQARIELETIEKERRNSK